MEPITRNEQFLDAVANWSGEDTLPEPITRNEHFLRAIYDALRGNPGTLQLVPITRNEHFLYEIYMAAKTGVDLTKDTITPEVLVEGYTAHDRYGNPIVGTMVRVFVKEILDPWEKIFAAIEDGSYTERYAVGSYKPLDLGSEGIVNMQIVAMDADEKADGSGKAPITWIAKELLSTSHRMNPENSNNEEGTGTIGGWEHSDMRSYLKETIWPLIPENVRSHIIEVTKYSAGFNTAGEKVSNMETSDDVWIPSAREIYGSVVETGGAVYDGIFHNNTMRRKMKVNGSSATNWWLRSASTTANFSFVGDAGTSYGSHAAGSLGVALGFCT